MISRPTTTTCTVCRDSDSWDRMNVEWERMIYIKRIAVMMMVVVTRTFVLIDQWSNVDDDMVEKSWLKMRILTDGQLMMCDDDDGNSSDNKMIMMEIVKVYGSDRWCNDDVGVQSDLPWNNDEDQFASIGRGNFTTMVSNWWQRRLSVHGIPAVTIPAVMTQPCRQRWSTKTIVVIMSWCPRWLTSVEMIVATMSLDDIIWTEKVFAYDDDDDDDGEDNAWAFYYVTIIVHIKY